MLWIEYCTFASKSRGLTVSDPPMWNKHYNQEMLNGSVLLTSVCYSRDVTDLCFVLAIQKVCHQTFASFARRLDIFVSNVYA